MDDLQKYIAEEKARNPEFAKEYDALAEEYTWRGEMVRKDTEITRLQARVAALKEALRPFAALTGDGLEHIPDDEVGADDNFGNSVTMGDIRKARDALEGKG